MNTSLYLIPPKNLLGSFPGDSVAEDSLFSLKCSPKEILLAGEKGALAPLFSKTLVLENPQEIWACVELVHIHATRDHLVLTDPSVLKIQKEEEEALRLSVQDLLSELTEEPIFANPERWLFKASPWKSLHTASPKLAMGLNIDTWMPKDTDTPGLARKWRQIQNEIQMIWHDHPVNLKRQSQDQLPINSLWLYGIGSAQELSPHPLLSKARLLLSNDPVYDSLSTFLSLPHKKLDGKTFEAIAGNWVDAEDIETPEIWESIWQQSLSALHSGKISSLEIFMAHLRESSRTEFISLKSNDLKSSYLMKIFSSKKARQKSHPRWIDFMKNLKR